jgi:hypothetical protein
MIRNFDIDAFFKANVDLERALEDGEYDSFESYMRSHGDAEIQKGLRKFHNEFAPFDETYYQKLFPEVAEAVQKGDFTSGYQHFSLHGYYEIIIGHRIWPGMRENNLQALLDYFDQEAYLEANPDVKAAIANGAFLSVEHYLRVHGLTKLEKGLDPYHRDYPPYDEETYTQLFPELTELVAGERIGSVFEHFCRIGYRQIVNGRWSLAPFSLDGRTEDASSRQVAGTKQLLVVGFHRSGTSMLTQWLRNAGLFVGRRLMEPNVSNVDGHFEDMDFFRLHEKILRYNQSSWQYTGETDLEVPEFYRREMRRLVKMRNREYEVWGFKDPRTVLFLEDWYEEMNDPYTVVIYRHYTETTRSLLQRAVRDWLANPHGSQLSFWRDPTRGYRMWLAYNRRLIEHCRRHSDRCIVVSQQAILEGYPIVTEIRDRFGIALDEKAPSGIDTGKLSSSAPLPPPPTSALKRELDEVWAQLQELSVVPAIEPSEEERKTVVSLDTVAEILKRLSISGDERDIIEETKRALDDPNLPFEEKIDWVRNQYPIFFYTAQEKLLIDGMEALCSQEMSSEALWEMLSLLYREVAKERETHYCDLMMMATAREIRPYHYLNISMGYFHFYRFDFADLFMEKALHGNPENPVFYMRAGTFEVAKCNYSKALKYYRRALELFEISSIGYLEVLIKIYEVYETLDENEKVSVLKEKILLSRSLHEKVPVWIDRLIEGFDEKELSDSDLMESWQNQVLSGLTHRSLLTELMYLSRVFSSPEVIDDFLERIVKLLKRVERGNNEK